MNPKDELLGGDEGLAIGPLIDVVFLLLIYFVVTSSLKSPEADLGITLPGSVQQSETLQMPDEQIIEILANGAVNVNNNMFPAEAGQNMPELVEMLTRYRVATEAANNKAMITIQAEAKTKHQRIIDVMNACAAAGLKHVSVGMGE